MTFVYAAIICGLIAVVYGFITSQQVLRASAGDTRMQDIAAAIQEGAKAYLGRQYTTIAIVGVIVAAIIFATLGIVSAIGFAIGAILSGVAGFVGMNISVRANVRTAEAARSSLQGGLTIAFRSGAITGMLVAGLGLLAISGFFWYLTGPGGHAPNDRVIIESLTALAFLFVTSKVIRPAATLAGDGAQPSGVSVIDTLAALPPSFESEPDDPDDEAQPLTTIAAAAAVAPNAMTRRAPGTAAIMLVSFHQTGLIEVRVARWVSRLVP